MPLTRYQTSANRLSTGLQDLIPSLTLTGHDNGDGSGTCTIQAKDAAGNSLAQYVCALVWVSTAEQGPPVAQTSFTPSNELYALTENAIVCAESNANGTIVIDIDHGGAGDVYVMAEIDGRVYSSGIIQITSE